MSDLNQLATPDERTALAVAEHVLGRPAVGAACTVAVTPEQVEKRGMAWILGAFLICPCHLPLTLGLAGLLLSGTALGAALRSHPFVAGSVISLVWLAATWRGFHLLRSARAYAARVKQGRPLAEEPCS
jgi:hypothetical protein